MAGCIALQGGRWGAALDQGESVWRCRLTNDAMLHPAGYAAGRMPHPIQAMGTQGGAPTHENQDEVDGPADKWDAAGRGDGGIKDPQLCEVR